MMTVHDQKAVRIAPREFSLSDMAGSPLCACSPARAGEQPRYSAPTPRVSPLHGGRVIARATLCAGFGGAGETDAREGSGGLRATKKPRTNPGLNL